MKKYHGYTKQGFLICCARNIILKIPYEQDHLLLEYGDEINNAIVSYLRGTTKENLEMIYQDKFDFKMSFDAAGRIFRMKFEYLH